MNGNLSLGRHGAAACSILDVDVRRTRDSDRDVRRSRNRDRDRRGDGGRDRLEALDVERDTPAYRSWGDQNRYGDRGHRDRAPPYDRRREGGHRDRAPPYDRRREGNRADYRSARGDRDRR